MYNYYINLSLLLKVIYWKLESLPFCDIYLCVHKSVCIDCAGAV